VSTQDRILAAARQLAQTQPLQDISLTAVAKEAGVSWPTVRRYLGNKQQLQAFLTQENPDGLAQAMVKHYLMFVPVWGMQEKLTRRDATLWYSQIMVESAQNILGVLAGLNRQYYSTFQFKRMGRFVDQLAIAPKNLALRLESLFHLKTDAAVFELEGLVRATIAIVETYMPQVDTASAKRKLGWRQQPWVELVC
jgi:AcrR family transcriptional regulator